MTEARDEINRAVDHERTNWRWLLIRAQIDGRAGNRSAAFVDLVRAKALAPRSPYLQPTLPSSGTSSALRPARNPSSAPDPTGNPLVFSGRPGPGAMERSPETRTLCDYLRAIKARRWLVIGTAVAAIAASIIVSVARTPVYKATATISVRSDFNASPGRPRPRRLRRAPPQKAAQVVTEPAVLAAASRALDGDRTPQQLQSDVTPTAEKDIDAVSVEAEAGTADGAARIANVVVAAMVQVTRDQQFRLFQSAVLRELQSGSGPVPAEAGRDRCESRARRSPRQSDLAQAAA